MTDDQKTGVGAAIIIILLCIGYFSFPVLVLLIMIGALIFIIKNYKEEKTEDVKKEDES